MVKIIFKRGHNTNEKCSIALASTLTFTLTDVFVWNIVLFSCLRRITERGGGVRAGRGIGGDHTQQESALPSIASFGIKGDAPRHR